MRADERSTLTGRHLADYVGTDHRAARPERGYFSSRDRRRSLSTLPAVCSSGQ
ncbi:MAG: hypothetical protein QOI73_3503 [Solirubrobacteraceae bacterium]|nr:hypothetical protein [Solirubrobacteraceae bacterium]